MTTPLADTLSPAFLETLLHYTWAPDLQKHGDNKCVSCEATKFWGDLLHHNR